MEAVLSKVMEIWADYLAWLNLKIVRIQLSWRKKGKERNIGKLWHSD